MRRKRIGILDHELESTDVFQISSWKGWAPLCHARNYDLVVLPSRRSLPLEPIPLYHNCLLRLPGADSLDGLLYTTTFLTIFKDYQLLIPDLLSLPSVTMSYDVGELPSVVIDNRGALEGLIRHTIVEHGRTRFGCIRGPAHNPEATVRFSVWEEVLKEQGLPVDNWVQGDFVPYATEAWIDELSAKGPFDALFCPNDIVAFSVIKILESRGIRVPADVSVIGFDDVPEARYENPSLSTINQPIEFQMAVALWTLMDRIEGKNIHPHRIVLPCRPVFRASCGCAPGEWSDFPLPENDPYFHGLCSRLDIPFDNPFSPHLRRHMVEEDRLFSFLKVLGHTSEAPALTTSDAALTLFQGLIEQHHHSYGLQKTLSRLLNELLRELSKSMDLNQIASALRHYLPQLGLENFLISITLDDEGNPAPIVPTPEPGHYLPIPPRRLRTLLAYPPVKDEPFAAIEYDSRLIVPEGWFDQSPEVSFVVLPLIVGDQWYGLGVFKLFPDNGLIYMNLQDQLAMILDREYRLEEVLKQNVNEQLKVRIETEKMQALTTLVAGVAHEVNTPLGIGITASTHLHEATAVLKSSFLDGRLGRLELDHYLNETDEGLSILIRNLMRADELVRSFKQVASEQPRDEIHSFQLHSFLEDILRILSPQLKRTTIVPSLIGPSDLKVTTYASPFVDIMTNLVMNAVIHGFGDPPPKESSIVIRFGPIADKPDWIRIEFEDNGRGINQESLAHIFEPFYTTRRGAGSTGLGLYIVYNLAVHRLGGTIVCESHIGEGTVFRLDFPRVAS